MLLEIVKLKGWDGKMKELGILLDITGRDGYVSLGKRGLFKGLWLSSGCVGYQLCLFHISTNAVTN